MNLCSCLNGKYNSSRRSQGAGVNNCCNSSAACYLLPATTNTYLLLQMSFLKIKKLTRKEDNGHYDVLLIDTT